MEYSETDEINLLLRAKKDLEWVRSNAGSFREEYNNRFIAVKNREILASSQTMESLLEALEKKGIDAGEVLVRYVSRVAMVL